jgi:signal peptidase
MFLAGTVPALAGYHPLIVMSGSMEPKIRTGDLVLVRSIPPLEGRVGDVVTFRNPSHPSRLLTHRVRHIAPAGNAVRFTTKGDRNGTVEHWTVSRNRLISRVAVRLPAMGYVMFWLNTPLSRIGLIVVPALVLGSLELRKLWRPHPPVAVDARA